MSSMDRGDSYSVAFVPLAFFTNNDGSRVETLGPDREDLRLFLKEPEGLLPAGAGLFLRFLKDV